MVEYRHSLWERVMNGRSVCRWCIWLIALSALFIALSAVDIFDLYAFTRLEDGAFETGRADTGLVRRPQTRDEFPSNERYLLTRAAFDGSSLLAGWILGMFVTTMAWRTRRRWHLWTV